MNHPFRAFLFRRYPWIIVVILIFALPTVVYLSKPDNLAGNIATLLGGMMGIIFFVQKQKIEELQIFERLFTQFNERYAKMNQNLQDIFAGKEEDKAKIQDHLNDYFNLCAEEYLFYKEGRILPEVWKSWCLGMMFYLRCERIKEHWVSEETNNSYYGLTFQIIEEGSK